MPGGYAEFYDGATHSVTTPLPNFDEFLWATLAEMVGDPSVTLSGAPTPGGLIFHDGLFIVTALIVTEVTVPSDAADQRFRLEGNLTFSTGIGT